MTLFIVLFYWYHVPAGTGAPAVMGYLLCRNMVYDYSSSLEQEKPYKTQCPPAFLELVYGRHCAIVPVFSGPLCFIYNILSFSHPTLPRSTESRPRFHWLVSTFPLSHRRLVGSAHKERVANHGHPLMNLDQCPRPSYLHRDGTSQSGVSTGEDFDPSTQWLWEV